MIAGAALLAALAYWTICARPGHPAAASAVKTASTALLALHGALADAPAAVVAGLALGSAGDLALSRPGQRAFLVGMAAFAAGHLAYAAQFWTAGGGMRALPATIVLLALAVSTEFWLAPRAGALRWPVRFYVAIIVAMGIAAATLPAGHGTIKTGAALFIASDLLLAIHRFVSPRKSLAHALWPAYWLGQALILLGAL